MGIFRLSSIIVWNIPDELQYIIYLTGQPIGVNTSVPSLGRKEAFFMTTYEEFMVLLTFAILVVAILDYVKHKK